MAAFGTFSLTIDVKAITGSDEKASATITPIPRPLIDDDGNVIFDKVRAYQFSGAHTFTLRTNSTSGDSTTVGYNVVVSTRHGQLLEAEFFAPQAGATLDITDVVEAVIDPVYPSTQAALDAAASAVAAASSAAAAAAVGTTNDTIIAGRVADNTSATNAALAKRYSYGISFTDPRIGGVGDGTTDNTTAWNTAMTLLASTGGELFFPQGVYCISGTTSVVPGGVLLRGTGINYGAPAGSATEGVTPSRGSVIRATAAMSRLIELGRNPTTSAQADTGASMQNLIVDGQNLADTVVKTAGRRNYITDCQIYWGNLRAVQVSGQNTYIRGGVQCQDNRGDVILVDGYFDHKIMDAQQRQPGLTGACIRLSNVGDILIRGNHMWTGANGESTVAEGLIVVESTCAVVGIVDNIIEGIVGPEIVLKPGNATQQNINITGNQFFNVPTVADATYPIISAIGGGASAFLSDVVVSGNIVRGQGSSHRFKAVVTYSGTFGGTGRWVIGDNSFFMVAFAVTGSASAVGLPKWSNNVFHDGTAAKYLDNSGEATFSGNGATTQFNIATGLIGVSGITWAVTPSSSVAAAPFYTFLSGSNIVLTFLTAPVTGTNNIKVMWRASANG